MDAGQEEIGHKASGARPEAEPASIRKAKPHLESDLESPKSPPPEDRGPPLDAAPPVKILWHWKGSTVSQDPRLLDPHYGKYLDSEELPPSFPDAADASGPVDGPVEDDAHASHSCAGDRGGSGHGLEDIESALFDWESDERRRPSTEAEDDLFDGLVRYGSYPLMTWGIGPKHGIA